MKKKSKIFGLTDEEIYEIKKDYAEKSKDPSFKIFSKEDIEKNESYQRCLKQNKEFTDKFSSDWLKDKIKLIISKYDWSHLTDEPPEDCKEDHKKYLEYHEECYTKRKEFFDMMAKYLVVFDYPELDKYIKN